MTPFTARNLSVWAYSQGVTGWHYKTIQQPLAEVFAPGFFNSACDLLCFGDFIVISGQDGGAHVYVTKPDDRTVAVHLMASAQVPVLSTPVVEPA